MLSVLKGFQSMEEARQSVLTPSGAISWDAGLSQTCTELPLGCYCLESVWSKPKDIRQVWICLNQPKAYGWGPWVLRLSRGAILPPQFVPQADLFFPTFLIYLQFYLHKFSKPEYHTALGLCLQCITTLIHHAVFNDGGSERDKSPCTS